MKRKYWFLHQGDWLEVTENQTLAHLTDNTWFRCPDNHDADDAPEEFNHETDLVYHRVDA